MVNRTGRSPPVLRDCFTCVSQLMLGWERRGANEQVGKFTLLTNSRHATRRKLSHKTHVIMLPRLWCVFVCTPVLRPAHKSESDDGQEDQWFHLLLKYSRIVTPGHVDVACERERIIAPSKESFARLGEAWGFLAQWGERVKESLLH